MCVVSVCVTNIFRANNYVCLHCLLFVPDIYFILFFFFKKHTFYTLYNPKYQYNESNVVKI